MQIANSVKLPSYIHILVYQHIRYTKQPDGHYREEIKQDSIICRSDENLDNIIPGLSYCPILDVYAARNHAPDCFEFYVVELDSAEQAS